LRGVRHQRRNRRAAIPPDIETSSEAPQINNTGAFIPISAANQREHRRLRNLEDAENPPVPELVRQRAADQAESPEIKPEIRIISPTVSFRGGAAGAGKAINRKRDGHPRDADSLDAHRRPDAGAEPLQVHLIQHFIKYIHFLSHLLNIQSGKRKSPGSLFRAQCALAVFKTYFIGLLSQENRHTKLRTGIR